MRWLGLLLGVLALAACSVTPPSSSPTNPSLASIKASAGIEPCVTSQTTDGGLPNETLDCLGGGTPVDLSTLKGPLIINLFQKQCGPCVLEMPALEAFHKKYGSRYPVLGIDSQDYIPQLALQIAAKRGVTYPLAADPDGTLQGTSLWARTGYPWTYLLTAEGQVKLVSAKGMSDLGEVEQDVAKALGHPLGRA